MKLVTLTSDFGEDDWFVGVMKGVLLQRCPGVVLVDITHRIPPGDVRAAAFVLRAATPYFPKGAVHLAVVDPGVGSGRPALALATTRAQFIAPDNGLLSWVVGDRRVRARHRIENPKLALHPISRTFHGRDVFAPAAAHLAGGGSIRRLGSAAASMKIMPWPHPKALDDDGRNWSGEVVYVDRFGNAITNFPNSLAAGERGRLMKGGRTLAHVAGYYQAVAKGRAAAIPGSAGWIEVAVHGGSAAQRWRLKVGSPLRFLSSLRK